MHKMITGGSQNLREWNLAIRETPPVRGGSRPKSGQFHFFLNPSPNVSCIGLCHKAWGFLRWNKYSNDMKWIFKWWWGTTPRYWVWARLILTWYISRLLLCEAVACHTKLFNVYIWMDQTKYHMRISLAHTQSLGVVEES